MVKRRSLAGLVVSLLPLLASHAFADPTSVRILPGEIRQTIDGFGTCLGEQDADSEWFSKLFLDDLQCSILRVDLTPHFKSPYADFDYNSPWMHGSPALPGPDDNNVRTYTGPADYGRPYANRRAAMAVMGPDIEQNLRYFDFEHPGWKSAGHLAKLGEAKKAELGDFKLVGSLWSPAPWLKVSSGKSIQSQRGPSFPRPGTPWPFIWAGNFSGGRFDTSGTPRAEFDDSALGGQGPTSALVQLARGAAAELRGLQRTYQVRFYAISLQNELNFEEFYNSCSYPRAEDYVAALKEIRHELDRYPDLKDILIMGPEDLLGDAYGLWQLGSGANRADKNLQYLQAVAADPEAARALAFFAIHGYASDGVTAAGAEPDLWRYWSQGWDEPPARGLPGSVDGFESHGRKSWMTESSGEAPVWLAPDRGFPNQGALGLALKIHQALTAGGESAWLYWQLSKGVETTPETLTDSRSLENSSKYAAAKHFFRAIRPGARRLETQVGDTTRLLASAYLHPSTAQLTVVLINPTSELQTVALQSLPVKQGLGRLDAWTSAQDNYWRSSTVPVQGREASVPIPGYGIVTLIGVGEVDVALAVAAPGGRTDQHAPARNAGGGRRGGHRSRWTTLAGAGAILVVLGCLLWRRRGRANGGKKNRPR
jgi:O-glycosyl hydrolase